MKKAKKYVYPILFSVGFAVSWMALVMVINATVSAEGYGGLGLGMLILFGWLMVALPVYCIRYSKIIVDEKGKLLFAAYNALWIILFHLLPFHLQGEGIIAALFILWVLLWNVAPLLCRVISRKRSANK